MKVSFVKNTLTKLRKYVVGRKESSILSNISMRMKELFVVNTDNNETINVFEYKLAYENIYEFNIYLYYFDSVPL